MWPEYRAAYLSERELSSSLRDSAIRHYEHASERTKKPRHENRQDRYEEASLPKSAYFD